MIVNGKYRTYDGKIGKLVGITNLNSCVEEWFDEDANIINLVMLKMGSGKYEYYLAHQLEEVEE